jgi:hypothetical protein
MENLDLFENPPLVRAQFAPWAFGIDLYIMAGKEYAVGNIEWVKRPNYAQSNSTLSLDKTAAQVLMDDLWNGGIRPTEGSGSAGSLRATEGHLADLRALLFHKMGVST